MIARGEYDDVGQVLWDVTGAGALLVLVIDGERGSGYSVKGSSRTIATLPIILREIADEIDCVP